MSLEHLTELTETGRDIITEQRSLSPFVVAWRNQRPLVGQPVATIRRQPSGLIQQMTQVQGQIRAHLRRRENLKADIRRAVQDGGPVHLEGFRQWAKEHLPAVTQLLFLHGGVVVADYMATVARHYQDSEQWMLIPPLRFVFNSGLTTFRCYRITRGSPRNDAEYFHPHVRSNELCFGTFLEGIASPDSGSSEWLMTVLAAIGKWRQIFNPNEAYELVGPYLSAENNDHHYRREPADFSPIEGTNGLIYNDCCLMPGSFAGGHTVEEGYSEEEDYCRDCDHLPCRCEPETYLCSVCDDYSTEYYSCDNCGHERCTVCSLYLQCENPNDCGAGCSSIEEPCRCCRQCGNPAERCRCGSTPISLVASAIAERLRVLLSGSGFCGCGSSPVGCNSSYPLGGPSCRYCLDMCRQIVARQVLQAGLHRGLAAPARILADLPSLSCSSCRWRASGCFCGPDYQRCSACQRAMRIYAETQTETTIGGTQ